MDGCKITYKMKYILKEYEEKYVEMWFTYEADGLITKGVENIELDYALIKKLEEDIEEHKNKKTIAIATIEAESYKNIDDIGKDDFIEYEVLSCDISSKIYIQ